MAPPHKPRKTYDQDLVYVRRLRELLLADPRFTGTMPILVEAFDMVLASVPLVDINPEAAVSVITAHTTRLRSAIDSRTATAAINPPPVATPSR